MGLIPAGAWLRAAEAGLPPVADPVALAGKEAPALVLAPHPDDESLGCGGLIAALCAAPGVPPPLVVLLTDGDASHPASDAFPPARLGALRREEAREAAAALGLPAARLHFLGLPDGGVSAQAAAAEAALRRLAVPRPGCVLACWGEDPHADHRATAAIAARLAGLLGTRLLHYPVWGLAHAYPIPGFPLPAPPLLPAPPRGLRLDIAAHLPAKRRAIAAHRSQHGAVPGLEGGFVLPAALLALADRPFEIFLEPAA